jgi:four helix bundle protein
MLDHERLDAYKCAIQFLGIAFALSDRMPRGYASLADQLRRAAMSIPLNIAEGSGKPDGPDRRRFHAIARGSAMECAAIFDAVALLVEGPELRLAEGKELLVRVVKMLSRLSR